MNQDKRKTRAAKENDRDEQQRLVSVLTARGREISTYTVLMHQAVADHFGFNATDHKCLDLVVSGAVRTPGELAERTGLTTGAITSVLDRLEKVGFVERVRGTGDRRQVEIRVLPEAGRRMLPLFLPLMEASYALYSRYTTEQLQFLEQHSQDVLAMMKVQITRVRAAKPVGRPGKGS